MRRLFFPLRLLACLGLAALSGAGYAADPPITVGEVSRSVTPELIKAKIDEAGASGKEDPATTKLIEHYRKALTFLESENVGRASAAAFSRARQEAPKEVSKLRAKLTEMDAKPSVAASLPVTEQSPLPEVERYLLSEKANLAAVEAKLANLGQRLSEETNRPGQARERLTDARRRQADIKAELDLPVQKDEPGALAEAKRWVLETENRALSAEIANLDQELLSQPARVELLSAQHEIVDHNNDRLGERVALVEALVSKMRSAESTQVRMEAETAQVEAAGKHPLIQSLAQRNAELSEDIARFSEALESVATGDDVLKKEARRIDEDFRNARRRLEVAGLGQVLGKVLHEQRHALPDLREFRKRANQTEKQVAGASLSLIQYQEESRRLHSVTRYVDELATGLSPEDAAAVQADLTELVRNRQGLLKKATALLRQYLQALVELELAHHQLFDAVQAFDSFLAEHLLWLRSAPPVGLDSLRTFPEQLGRLLEPADWLRVLNILVTSLPRSPTMMLALLLFALLLWKSQYFYDALKESGEQVGKISTDRFLYTFQAVIWTLLLAAPWPLLLATLAWQLQVSMEATGFPNAIGVGLDWVWPPLLYLQVFRVLCKPGGLAAAHFRWSEASLKLLRHQVYLLLVFFLPPAFATIVAISLDWEAYGGGLVRVLLLVVLVSLAGFTVRLFRPQHGVLAELPLRRSGTRTRGLGYVWIVLSVGVILALALAELAGFVYTAGELASRLVDSLWLVLGLIVVQQLVVRWLLLVQRRLALKAALARREAAQAAAESTESATATAEDAPIAIEEPRVDLVTLSTESYRLLETAILITGLFGLWLVWSDVLPAFGILDDLVLWHHTKVVSGEEVLEAVTLVDAFYAILILFVAVVGVRQLPVILEILMLQNRSLTASDRYTVTSITRYIIIVVGTVLFFNIVGGDWSQIQWLVAALGVGIGFGMQEIVANFISGIIILFERPIRIGDYVSVGESDGTVTRIQIRATTIVTRDRKELLVPNKEFITGRLLNWSLSDQTTRLMVSVGVAYGSDVKRAMALMLEAVHENELILDDPEPMVTFEGFGDNALTLNVRFFIASIDNRLRSISAIHESINRKFSEAGISIAFPQRDVHLDTSGPLDIRIRREDGSPGGEGEK